MALVRQIDADADDYQFWFDQYNMLLDNLDLLGEDDSQSFVTTVASPNKLVKTQGDGYIDSSLIPLVVRASTADKWTTARTLSLGNQLAGSVLIDGSANVTLNATINGFTTGSATVLAAVATGVATTIDQFAVSTSRAASWLIYVTDGTHTQTSRVHGTYNGTLVRVEAFGDTYTSNGPLLEFNSGGSGGNFLLQGIKTAEVAVGQDLTIRFRRDNLPL